MKENDGIKLDQNNNVEIPSSVDLNDTKEKLEEYEDKQSLTKIIVKSGSNLSEGLSEWMDNLNNTSESFETE